MAEPTDQKLIQHIEAVEKLEEEKKGIGGEIKDRLALAKHDGYAPKMVRKMIKLRKLEREERLREEAEELVYRCAVGLE